MTSFRTSAKVHHETAQGGKFLYACRRDFVSDPKIGSTSTGRPRFLYACRRDFVSDEDAVRRDPTNPMQLLYACRRDFVSDSIHIYRIKWLTDGFYTPVGVTSFRTQEKA